jgi:hypothetical protein
LNEEIRALAAELAALRSSGGPPFSSPFLATESLRGIGNTAFSLPDMVQQPQQKS